MCDVAGGVAGGVRCFWVLCCVVFFCLFVQFNMGVVWCLQVFTGCFFMCAAGDGVWCVTGGYFYLLLSTFIYFCLLVGLCGVGDVLSKFIQDL